MVKSILSIWLFCLLITNVFSVPGEESTALNCLGRAKTLYDRSEYDSLPYYYRISGSIFHKFGNFGKSAECMLGMVDYYRMLNLQYDANSMLDSAESYIEEHLGLNSESWADALYTRAKVYTGQNRHKESISILNSCLELQKSLNMEPVKIARTHDVLGTAYFTLGDLENAEVNYHKSLEIFMGISGEAMREKGTLFFNLGVLYSKLNNPKMWAEYTTRGIENDILLFGPLFPDLAGYYNSLSSYYISAGLMDSARHYLDRAEMILVNAYGDEYYDLNRIYINRARIYRYEGDYNSSLEYYLNALRILENQEIPRRSLANILYVNIGNLYAAMGDYHAAYHYRIRLLQAEGMVHPSKMAVFYSYIADNLIKLGRYDEAKGYLQKVFNIRDKYFRADHFGLIYDYNTLGVLMDSTGRKEEAGNYYKKALSITVHNYGNYHFRTARIYKTLGDHYAGTADLDNAIDQYQRAIHSLVPEYNMLDWARNPDPEGVTDLLFYLKILKQKAWVLESFAGESLSAEQKGILKDAAFSTYGTSVQVIELLRTSYLNDESKLYLSENERNTYEKCVETAYQCYELTSDPEYLKQAFLNAEKAKYATLKSALHREEALSLSGIPDSIRQLEKGMQKQLSVFQELLRERQNDTLPDQSELQHYRSGIFRLKDGLAGLHRSLESDYPEYYELLYSQQFAEPGDLARKLGRRDKIMEYFIAGKDLYIFEISRNEFACHRDSIDRIFKADLDLLTRYVSSNSIRDTIQDDHPAFIASATRLHKRLIKSTGGIRNLIIIPEGELSYFPFDILITEPVPGFTGLFNQLPFLICKFTVRYGYSASLISRQNQRTPGNLHRFIGFAPGYMTSRENINSVDSRREIRVEREFLEALPGSIDEVKELGDLLGGEVFTGDSASEGKFKELAEESHIIHLATHAFLDDEDPLRSTLVFADNDLNNEDGLLRVHELYNMNLKARMVVLSACNTGTGEQRSGEGIISLARAFYYAGVPNIVMTLWTVSDKQSYKLMLSFYKQLRKGRKAESSLRRAKLEFLETALPGYQHPRYWAGYILVGNPGKLFMSRFHRQLIAAAAVFLILLAGWMTARKSINRKGQG